MKFERDPKKALLDRLPPHSIEAEQALLGCCLLDSMAIGECMEQIRPDAFYDLKHRELYEILLRMYEARVPVDLVTVVQTLTDCGKLDAVGGPGYLQELPDEAGSAASVNFFLDVVREKYLMRRLVQTCSGLVADIYAEPGGGVDGFFDRLERDILELNATRVAPRELHIRVPLQAVVERIEDFHRGKAQMLGVPTGFAYLDKMLLGWMPGQMSVVAARPGLGKTSIGMQFVTYLACEKNIPCGVFTLEMSGLELASRTVFQMAIADYQRYRSGFMQNDDIPKLVDANARLTKAPIFLDETAGINVLQLRARARRWRHQHKIGFLLIDYLQLMRPTRWFQNREQEVAEISGGIKALAKELQIPIVVLAQLNRDLEKSPNRKPQLSDLRESGAIEQDADVVAFLYSPKVKPEELEELELRHGKVDWSDNWRRINLLIAKQRQGPTGDCQLLYRKKCMRFESV